MKPRAQPQRTCVGCKRVEPKGGLLRLAASSLGQVAADPGATMPGRGVYVHPACLDVAISKKAVARGLRVGLDSDAAVRLRNYIESMGAL